MSHRDFVSVIVEHLLTYHRWNDTWKNKKDISHEQLIDKLLLKYEKTKRRDCVDCKKNNVRYSTYFYCRLCFLENNI